MDRLNKSFEPITTLIIIYLGLVTISIAIYALIQMYVEEKELAASLLGWSATMFATIALLYTFNSWRNQKASEILSYESKLIFKFVHQNYQLFNDLFSEKELMRKKELYQKVRENYLESLENLNLYNGLIGKMKNNLTKQEFKNYMDMLDKIFKEPNYDQKRLNENKNYIFKCSDILEGKLIDIILHLDSEST